MAYADRADVIVLGLPRGGVAVACEVAKALHAPLDAFRVRNFGVPGHEERGMAAIAGGGVRVITPQVIADLQIPDAAIGAVTAEVPEWLDGAALQRELGAWS